jgi:hypothetical protein
MAVFFDLASALRLRSMVEKNTGAVVAIVVLGGREVRAL